MLSTLERQQIITAVRGDPDRAARTLTSLQHRGISSDDPELVATLSAVAQAPDPSATSTSSAIHRPAEQIPAEPTPLPSDTTGRADTGLPGRREPPGRRGRAPTGRRG
ncbi:MULTISPECIES: hypothetical protein [Frankia]|nr:MULTISPECIES: hypothetical protein [Frankia]